MKITLNQDPAFPETEIIINCPQADEDILHLVAMLPPTSTSAGFALSVRSWEDV